MRNTSGMHAFPPDRFEEWLCAPVAATGADPRFEVRRAAAADFNRIYDLLSEVAGKRKRAAYEWLYRDNPNGTARCWMVIERQTGAVVGVEVKFPWPVLHGTAPLAGFLGGTVAVAPGREADGIARLAADGALSHPWHGAETVISWPNDGIPGAANTPGRGEQYCAAVSSMALPLRARECLAALGWSRPLSIGVGFLTQGALEVRWMRRLRGADKVRIEPVRRFDGSFNAVTEGCMAWPGFWCPHDARFLNWRYLDNPVGEYLALAAVDGGMPTGYCVLRLAGSRAWLAELAVPREPVEIQRALLAAAIGVAREGGCIRLDFFAPPRWRHWKFLHALGFVGARTDRLLCIDSQSEPSAHDLNAWQVLPGDAIDLWDE